MQRVLDFLLSGLAILALSPILLPVAIVLKLTGEGEIFYIQNRVGKDGEHFGLYKFATMIKDSPNIGTGEVTIKDDPRVLPVGKFLRKSKINELPQLLNIFLGHMSVVGPRPMVPNTFSNYSAESQEILNSVRPGLTGIGSIIFRDEESFLDGLENPIDFYSNTIAPHKSDLEVWFVKNNSLYLYFKIIIVTAIVVLFPKSLIVNRAFTDLPKLPDLLKYK